MKININLNEQFTVILTEEGAKIYNEFNDQFLFLNESPKQLKEGDKLKDELWSLMQIFGPKLHNGCEIPFELNQITFGSEY